MADFMAAQSKKIGTRLDYGARAICNPREATARGIWNAV